MPDLIFGAGTYRRDNGNLPELRLVNMYLEAAVTGRKGAVLLSRPGLQEAVSAGTGPVSGVFRAPGVFGGDIFWRSGTTLYRGTTSLGTVAGTGPVSFAVSPLALLVTAGSTLYRYNGTTLTAVAFPDGAGVVKVLYHDGVFVAIRAGTGRWYFTSDLTGATWDGLDYATAERKQDETLDAFVLNDTAIFLGADSTEPWANTGDPELPFQRIEQRTFQIGVLATGCAAELDNTLFFVGSDRIVYRLSDVPQRISDHGIEGRIANSGTCSAFAFKHEGHAFFCVRLDTGTFGFDVATGQWSELASYGRANFRAQVAAMVSGAALFGDDTEGKLLTFGGWEDDGNPLERLFSVATPLTGGSARIDSLELDANTGWTNEIAGQGSNPVVELRTSRDAGATFGEWRGASLGEQGRYRRRARWRRLGQFDAPGMLGEVRCTDPVPFRVSGVTVNEPGGGRSR